MIYAPHLQTDWKSYMGIERGNTASGSARNGGCVSLGVMETHMTWKSPTIMRGNDMTTKKQLHPIHPGEVLLEEFLKPMKLSQNRVALQMGVHPRRINEIVLGKRRITAETALRLARYFGTTPQFWLGLQADYDLDMASDELGKRLDQEVKVHAKVS